MEISSNTVNVLKNFGTINSNIVINPGNKLMTIAEAKNVLAEAIVDETFDQTLGIYDLNEFLNVLSLVDNPSVRFGEQSMQIGGNAGRASVKYYYSDTDILTSPQKPIIMPDPDVWFTLDQDTLTNIKRAAMSLGHSQMLIEPDDGVILLTVVDTENTTSNSYSISVDGGYNEDSFKFIINISNLKMISDSYDVKISKKLISQFTSSDEKLNYWVALEKNSTYGD
jgi:hypothetical protein